MSDSTQPSEPYSGPDFDALRKSLSELVTGGVVPYNVAENGGALLNLDIVSSRIKVGPETDEEEQERAQAQALLAVLTSAVDKKQLMQRKHRRLLKYVLPLKDEYAGKTIEERRRAAGENLTDGKRVVKSGTIRTYYEPRALDQLAITLVRMEAEHRGQAFPAALADTR